MDRTDFLLDLVRTHNVLAASALIALMVAGRLLLGKRSNAWLVVLFALLAVVLGYMLRTGSG